jgi:long-chain alkane monooxygenase
MLTGRDDKAIGSVVVGLTRSEAQEKYQRIQQCIPPEGAMAWISGHFGPVFSKYDPDEVSWCRNCTAPGRDPRKTDSFTRISTATLLPWNFYYPG